LLSAPVGVGSGVPKVGVDVWVDWAGV